MKQRNTKLKFTFKFSGTFKKILAFCFSFIIICGAVWLLSNIIVYNNSKDYIVNIDDLDGEYDCVMVLGAGVWGDYPSPMLGERLDFGISVFETGVTDRILMSGDHGKETYDEVNVMKNYAIEDDIPSDCIFMDHAGFSTYESMYRARDVFQVKKMIIVTQEYHLYRAIYDARKLGIDAYGVKANKLIYSKDVQAFNNCRESLARTKDFIWCIFKPLPTYLGEEIPITASGSLTDDKVKT